MLKLNSRFELNYETNQDAKEKKKRRKWEDYDWIHVSTLSYKMELSYTENKQ